MGDYPRDAAAVTLNPKPREPHDMDIYNADDVKAVADIGAFIGEHITLKRKGGKMVGLCPFHDEKTSSFTVYDDHYHCFGCKETGDIIAFAEKYLKLNFLEALDAVGKRFKSQTELLP